MVDTVRQQAWAEVKKKYRLSAATVEKAMKWGLNSKRLGSLANHKQEPWKEPLPDFIDALYEKRFNVKEG